MATTSPNVHSFLAALGDVDGDQLAGVLNAIAARDSDGSADASWWDATVHVEALLGASQRRREATAAGQRAALAVRLAADRRGLGSFPTGLIRVLARSASEAARALVATESDAGASSFLLGPWRAVIDEVTGPPATERRVA
jgi:hypothetical protein